MRHIKTVSRNVPAKAFYYNLSLTQKLTELATIVSALDSVKNMLVGGVDTRE